MNRVIRYSAKIAISLLLSQIDDHNNTVNCRIWKCEIDLKRRLNLNLYNFSYEIKHKVFAPDAYSRGLKWLMQLRQLKVQKCIFAKYILQMYLSNFKPDIFTGLTFKLRTTRLLG